MASDISLAVGGGARRMTYAELAAIRGTSQNSVERLVRRRGWPRQLENDGVVRVLVPLSEVKNVKEPRPDDVASVSGWVAPPTTPPSPPTYIPLPAPDILPIIRETLRELIEPLSAQLEQERQRAEDANAAERISTALASSLRAEFQRRQEWGLWRRLGWALTGR